MGWNKFCLCRSWSSLLLFLWVRHHLTDWRELCELHLRIFKGQWWLLGFSAGGSEGCVCSHTQRAQTGGPWGLLLPRGGGCFAVARAPSWVWDSGLTKAAFHWWNITSGIFIPHPSLLTGAASFIENSNSLTLGVEQCDITNKSNDNLFTEYQLVFRFLREWRLGMENRLDNTR